MDQRWAKNGPKMGKGLKSTMISVSVTAGVIYLVVVAYMYAFQRNMLYYPNVVKPARLQSGVADMEEVVFTTEDGLDLFAWYAPPQDPAKPTVVIFHGNGGNVGDRGFKARLFIGDGYGVMLAEYRGYAGNPGAPSEQGLYADARAALNYLQGRGVEGADLVLYGESLGTGVATAMAIEAQKRAKPVAAMVLEAPFTSAADVGASHYPFLPVRLLIKDRFNSRVRMAALHVPVLIIHGEQDKTVPIKFGKRLFDAANEPKESLWVQEAAHNDLFDNGVSARVLDFLARYAVGTRTGL